MELETVGTEAQGGQKEQGGDNDALLNIQEQLLSSFDQSLTAQQDGDTPVDSDIRDQLAGVIKNPSTIDSLSAYDAKMLREEVNRIYCGGAYDYMMPNKAHDKGGKEYAGVVGGQFDDKTMLRQVAQDVAWMNAAQKGVGELYKLLNKDFGAGLGISGDEYAGLSLQEKTDRILKAKAVTGADELASSFDAWMNSWNTALKTKERDVPVGAVGGAVITRKEPTEEYKKAMRKIGDYDDSEVIPITENGRYAYQKYVTQPFKKGIFWDAQEQFEWRGNINGVATVDGKKYTLVSKDEKGERLAAPYFVAEDGSTLQGHIQGMAEGAHDFYKFSQYDEKNPVHEEAVREAMRRVDARDFNDFCEKVWMGDGRIMETNGDRFYARRLPNGKFRLEVGDGGRTEYNYSVVKKYQDQFENERNAMNAIMVREIFNANPDVLKWYQRYKATADDNIGGRFDRRGDWEGVLNEFLAEAAPYLKDDSELDAAGIEKKNHYQNTFAQLIDVLGMTDHREGFGYLGSAWTDWASGAGNTGLQFVNSTYNLFADGLSFYRHLFDSDETYFDRFKNWAREDMKFATATQIYDQGTLTGLIGGEAAQLLAFSGMMKVGSAANLLNYFGRGVNATGRAMKAIRLAKAGQKMKSVGQSLVEAGRKIGGGSKTVVGGFSRIEVPKNGKIPKGAIRVGEEWFMPQTKNVKVGNFMQEYNKEVARVQKEIETALEKQKGVAAELTGRIGVDEATWQKVYDGIDSLERKAAQQIGRGYGEVSQWCLDIANELPALIVAGGAMADSHKAMSYYKIGEGFVERDETGAVKKMNFDYEPLNVAEKYAIYDGAGNTAFMLHIPKVLKSVIAGEAGSRRLQTAARGWYNNVMEAMSKGDFNRANALVAMYENAPRRLVVNSLKGGMIGAGMAATSQVVENAENIALAKLQDPNRVFTVSDYLLDEEQSWNTVKSFGRMAAGMMAVGGVSGVTREAMGNLSRNWRMVTSMKQFGDSNLDLWAIIAGTAYRRGKQVVDFNRLDANPEVAARQIRQSLMADAETYRELSADTDDFIKRLVDANAAGESDADIRKEMAGKYGEEYARVMDSVIDYVRQTPSLITRYAQKYAESKADTKQGSFVDFGMKDIVKGVGDLLGIKVRRPKKLGNGMYQLNIDVGGRNGWLNLEYRNESFDAKVRFQNDDGSFAYDKGYATDVVDGLTGKDSSFDIPAYKELKDEVAKLSPDDLTRLYNGEDANQILSRAHDIMEKEGGGATGVFVNVPQFGSDGKTVVGTKRVAMMNRDFNELHMVDFAHETAHGIVAQLRDMGYFRRETTDADGNKTVTDNEDVLRRFYGKEGSAWEEDFVRDLLEGRLVERFNTAAEEGVRKLFQSDNPVAKLARGVAKILKAPFATGGNKPVRSPVEKALDAKIEEAKAAVENEKIEKAADEVRIQNEIPEEVAADVEAKTPESTALVVSRQPIPNDVMMKDVPADQIERRTAELNASGFYYDSQHDVWVNEHSAPTLFHRAVNEAIATKVKTRNDMLKEAFDLFQKTQADLAAAIKAEEEKGSAADVVKQVRDRFIEERRQRIRELVSPADFTKAERDKMGIVVNRNGEPLGVVVSEYDFINDGKRIYSHEDLPSDAEIVPYDHDLHGRWAVKASRRALADRKLVAIHNLSPEYAHRFLRNGEVAGISVAVQPEGEINNAFGLVSLLFGKRTIDPAEIDAKGRASNFLFDRDAGTGLRSDYTNGRESEAAVAEKYWRIMDEKFNRNASPSDAKRLGTVEELRKMVVIGKDGSMSLPYGIGEAKLARLVEVAEVKAIALPRFSKELIDNAGEYLTINLRAVKELADKFGGNPHEIAKAVQAVIETGAELPARFSSLVERKNNAADIMKHIEAVERIAKERGIPIRYWDAKSITPSAENAQARSDAVNTLAEKVKDVKFNVVGSSDRRLTALHNKSPRGALRFLQEKKGAGFSVAVVPSGVSHNGFGIVTLFFGKNSVNPTKKDENGVSQNYLFDRDMGLPQYGDIWTGTDPNRRNIFQQPNDEAYFGMNEDGSLTRFNTPEEVAKGFSDYMNFEYDQYQSRKYAKHKMKTLDSLRKKIVVDENGEQSLPEIYGEAKLARLVEAGEVIGISMPKVTDSLAAKYPQECKDLNEIARLAEAMSIPVEYWETDTLAIDAKNLAPRTDAVKRMNTRVQETRFGVVGSRGASRYFAENIGDVMGDIRSTIEEAVAAVDEGTRKGLKSSKNAELNKWLKDSGKDKFGPFILHIGGTDGDPKPRLEYAGKKPKTPYEFLKRVDDGETFHLSDFLGNAVRQDEVFNKAYPELMNTRIYIRGANETKEAGIKEPAWGDDNTFILANEDGQIVIDRRRWNDRLVPQQMAEVIVGLVQKTEGWQERIRQSDARVAEALSPMRKKRSGSDLAFRLIDPRLILGDRIGPLVEGAVRKYFDGKRNVDDKMLKDISEAVIETIRSSVKDFAGEAEAKFLASRFGMKEDALRDYSAAEEVFKNTLLALGEGTTSAEQTKKNLAYWDNVILKAVDVALFGRHAGRKGKNTEQSIRPEFRDAIANEIMEAIVRNISSGSRAARTDLEARLAGVRGRGMRGTPTDSADRLGVAFDGAEGERTLITESNVKDIDLDAPMGGSGGQAIIDVTTIDAKWEKAKESVAAQIREELGRIREVVAKDIGKAKSEQEKLLKKIRKLVDENSTTSDVLVKDSMFDEALRMAQGNGRFRVVGARRTPKRLLTEAAAARIARTRMDGHRNDDRTRIWLETEAARIGVMEADRAAFVAEVMNDALAVAEAIVRRSRPSRDMADVIKAAEDGTARREFVKQVLNGFRGGYSVGARGADAAIRARSEANRIRTKMVKDARGLGLTELNTMLGGDIVKDIVTMRDTFGNGDAFAVQLIKKFSDWMIANDPRFARMTTEEFENSPVARAELAHTISAWLRETARQLDYGQSREWAMRESARLQKQPQTFGSIHMTVAKHAERLADGIDKQNVDALLDQIDKQIDTYADGDATVAQSVPNYQRKIAPRLQEYWRYVKKAMRMTDDAVEKEVNRLNALLNMSDKQLLDLGTKGSDDLDAAESGIRQREDAMMKLNALLRFGSMKYKNYGECMGIFNGQMAGELAGQMQRHMVMRDKRLADDAAIRQAFIGELTAIRRSKKGGDFDALDNGTRLGNFLTFSVADLFKRMQLYLHEGTDAWNFVDSFRQDMSLGHIDQTVFISDWEGKMREAVQDIYGENFERLVEDMMTKRPEYDRFSRSGWTIPDNAKEVEVWKDGRKRTVKVAEPSNASSPTNLPNHLSKANLLYIYAACQQADMQINNVIWGRDAKYLREIEAIIGPEGVQMAQWLTRAYSEIRKALDPISREISGMPVLSPDERYCPLSFIQDLVSNDERRFTSSPFPSFLTRRVTHDTLRLNEQCDAFRMFEDKIQDSGHYIGFARIIDRMNTTLKHPKVQTAYAQLYGTKAKNDIYAQLTDALNGGRKNSDTLLSGARNFVTASSLFGNVGSALKQLEGVGGWAVEMGIGPWLRGLVRNPMTSKEIRDGVRELIDAGLFLTRSEEGISEAMVALMNSCDGVPAGPVSRTYRWYKRHGMDITKFVDKIASMSMAGQYYTGRKNWYIEQGLREEDAKRRALADTDYAIQATQQSGRSEFLHAAQRGGTAGKMLTQFSGPAFVRWGIECASWHRALVMGDRGAYGKLLSRMVALHLICPAVLSLAGGISGIMFRRDDQKMKDVIERTEKDIIVNCLTGPMSGWFIFGQVLNAFAYETVMPDTKGARTKTHFEAPVLSKLHSLQSATSKIFKDVIKAAPWDTFTEREQRMIAEDALQIFDLLIPASRVRHAVRNAVDAVTE